MRYLVNSVNNFDLFLLDKIFSRSNKKLFEQIFYWLSRSGDGPLYALLAGIIFLFEPHSGKNIIMGLSLAFLVDLSLYRVIKNSIKRDRPFEKVAGIRHLIQPPDKFSFPSGHTAAAFLVATILSHYYPFIDGPVFLWAALVGLSRVYLGVHYPSDVLAGGFLGFMSASLSLVVI